MWTNILIGTLLVLNLITCGLLVMIVLMQRSKQDGLGASFGSGLTDSMFGAQTSNVLVKATSFLTACFFFFSISLAWLYGHQQRGSLIQNKFKTEAAAPETAAPAVTPSTPTASEPAPTPAATEPQAPAAASTPSPEASAKPTETAPAKKDPAKK